MPCSASSITASWPFGSQPFAGSWTDLAATAQAMVENEHLERRAEQACRSLAGRLGESLKAPRQTGL